MTGLGKPEFAVAIVIAGIVALLAMIVLILPGAEGNDDPVVEFDLIDVPMARAINEDGYAEVFYNDQIRVDPDVYDPNGDDIVEYEWIFEVNGSGPQTNDDREDFIFNVGHEHLYPFEDGGEPVPPWPNSAPEDYIVTLRAHDDEGGVGEYSMDVVVHPYAQNEWVRHVKFGPTLLDVWVELLWRGFVDEAAPSESHISEDRPVFVFVEESENPIPDLFTSGGLGKVFDIYNWGCYLQDGSEGFIEAEIKMPFLTSSIENYGHSIMLQEEIKLEYYDEIEQQFLPVPDSYVISEGGYKYAVGSVDHFSLFAAVIDVIYNESHPDYLNYLPDLSVQDITFSRAPVLEGQELEIRADIRNTGMTHGRNVTVDFYDNDVHIGNTTVEVVEAGEAPITVTQIFSPMNNETRSNFQDHNIVVKVNEQRAITEHPDNYVNNELNMELPVIRPTGSNLQVEISSPANGTIVKGSVNISGTANASIGDTDITITEVPFGNNDHAINIVQVNPEPPSVSSMFYAMLDDRGTAIPGVQGTVDDIYGLFFNDQYVNISFQDNDRDGLISAGDVFLIKQAYNGGQWQDGYDLIIRDLDQVEIDSVLLSIGGKPRTDARGTDNWTFDLDTTTLANGEVTVSAYSSDGISFSTAHEITLIVDNPEPNVPPTITITSPEDGSKLSGKVTMKGTTTDTDGVVTKIEIRIGEDEWQLINGTGSWEFILDTNKISNGSYNIKVRCFDGEDFSNISSISITVENKDNKETNEKDDDGGGDGFIPFVHFQEILLIMILAALMYQFKRKSIKY